jgi:hypothetical protein
VPEAFRYECSEALQEAPGYKSAASFRALLLYCMLYFFTARLQERCLFQSFTSLLHALLLYCQVTRALPLSEHAALIGLLAVTSAKVQILTQLPVQKYKY